MLLTDLLKEISNPNKYEDGEITLYGREVVWNLHLIKGQFLYATDTLHPVRRWDRALRQHGSNWNWQTELSRIKNSQFWACYLLSKGVSREQLSLIRAKLVIRSVIQECLFELCGYPELKVDWVANDKGLSSSCRFLALSSWEVQTVVNRALKLHRHWQQAGLGHLNPNLSPVLKQAIAPSRLPIPDKYLSGQFTLWDIAWQNEKTIIEVIQSLLPLVEQDCLQLQDIPDLPLPEMQPTPAEPLPANSANPVNSAKPSAPPPPPPPSALSSTKQPLIACIDDSPVLAHTLNRILNPAGYRTLNIQEPMRGFTQLIEHKPDLILLDLLLPNADGYSVCKFLRDTPIFEHTPIIILTAQNTIVDRARAKLAGATEFLGKPPQPNELLQMVRKYV
jgi:two-component system, chemotaxis family, response regulator PixG